MRDTLTLMQSLLKGVKSGDVNSLPAQYQNCDNWVVERSESVIFAQAFVEIYPRALMIAGKYKSIDNEEKESRALQVLDRVLRAHGCTKEGKVDTRVSKWQTRFGQAYANELYDRVKANKSAGKKAHQYQCLHESPTILMDDGNEVERPEFAAQDKESYFEEYLKPLNSHEKAICRAFFVEGVAIATHKEKNAKETIITHVLPVISGRMKRSIRTKLQLAGMACV